MVEEGDIKRIIIRSEDDPQKACEELVDSANDKGGIDNITVILVDCQKDEGEVGLMERAFLSIIGGLGRAFGRIPGLLRGQKKEKLSESGGQKGEAVM